MHTTEHKIIGNSRVLESLGRIARSPHLGHAYLFFGPEGIGKRLVALAFARAINCHCADESPQCDSCRLMDSLSHPELLLLQDVNKPLWFLRSKIRHAAGLGGSRWKSEYAELITGLYEKGYLEEPLPRAKSDVAVDGFNIATDRLFGRGSVPSRECYTPQAVSEEIRKSYDQGSLSEQEYSLVRMLYEYPLSVMPYRGAVPIAYVTSRKTWKFTRPIQAFLSVRTMLGGKKIVVIDDAHKMTAEAQNCLLKTLEEPPADSVLMLVTSDKRGLFETIVSRCQVVNFGRLTREETDQAVKDLLGGSLENAGLISALSENCPGRLLELGLEDVAGRLGNICDFFSDVAEGGLTAAFRLSRAVTEAGGSHRRKQRQTVTEALELVGFWIAEILRVKGGMSATVGAPVFSQALKEHAKGFDQSALLQASEDLEKAFGLVRWNIDMRLLLDTTLLRLARTLKGS
jgi:DNA polymerase-3 subunit delta'